MGDSNEKRGTVGALLKPIEDIFRTLAGPAAEEFGLSLHDSVKVFRTKRQIRLFKKVKKLCEQARIDPHPVNTNLFRNIVENASYEADDELQDMWANLLTNAAGSRESHITPAFPEILKQLSKNEAMLLNRLFEQPHRLFFEVKEPYYMAELDELVVSNITIPQWNSEEIWSSWSAVVNKSESGRFSLCIDNLKRLGIIRFEELSDGMMDIAVDKKLFAFTILGYKFVEACSTPKASTNQL